MSVYVSLCLCLSIVYLAISRFSTNTFPNTFLFTSFDTTNVYVFSLKYPNCLIASGTFYVHVHRTACLSITKIHFIYMCMWVLSSPYISPYSFHLYSLEDIVLIRWSAVRWRCGERRACCECVSEQLFAIQTRPRRIAHSVKPALLAVMAPLMPLIKRFTLNGPTPSPTRAHIYFPQPSNIR